MAHCIGFRCRRPLGASAWHGLCPECRAQQLKDEAANKAALARGEELRDPNGDDSAATEET